MKQLRVTEEDLKNKIADLRIHIGKAENSSERELLRLASQLEHVEAERNHLQADLETYLEAVKEAESLEMETYDPAAPENPNERTEKKLCAGVDAFKAIVRNTREKNPSRGNSWWYTTGTVSGATSIQREFGLRGNIAPLFQAILAFWLQCSRDEIKAVAPLPNHSSQCMHT